ncbi:MAG TPA: hypothetical protein VMW50_06305 [Dehalococcoidia bacterium]|nr:hypothetical protein [Dehalococcoidia bacterium]
MAEDLSDLFDIMEKQEGFFIVADELFVNPFKNMLCQIEELPRRGIIHTESH